MGINGYQAPKIGLAERISDFFGLSWFSAGVTDSGDR
jgi:hypothetical protein